MRLFDTHAHLHDELFAPDLSEVIARVDGLILTQGCDIESSEFGIELAKKHVNVYAAVGIHPHDSAGAQEGYIERLAELSAADKVVAIGETGVDYHYDFSPKEVQLRVFEEQLILARELELPIVVHMREATVDTMALLHKYRPKGVMHCFSGSAETAAECVKLGLYISFSGSVTFKNANRLVRAAQYVPEDRLLAETDCPYLSPEPMRGRRNEPSYTAYTVTRLAEIRGVEPEELARITLENGKRLFNIA